MRSNETLERGEQVMVFLNRRGYAPVLMCQQCGWHGHCERCDAHLTWHRSHRPAVLPPLWQPAACAPHCVRIAGPTRWSAPERVRSNWRKSLAKRFPDFPVLRFDRDQTSGKGVMDEQLEQVRTAQPCLLVGTQMLAKGHHFPGVTLVVIVNIDQALYSADFRALERMGQMIAAGCRQGRAHGESRHGHPADAASGS